MSWAPEGCEGRSQEAGRSSSQKSGPRRAPRLLFQNIAEGNWIGIDTNGFDSVGLSFVDYWSSPFGPNDLGGVHRPLQYQYTHSRRAFNYHNNHQCHWLSQLLSPIKLVKYLCIINALGWNIIFHNSLKVCVKWRHVEADTLWKWPLLSSSSSLLSSSSSSLLSSSSSSMWRQTLYESGRDGGRLIWVWPGGNRQNLPKDGQSFCPLHLKHGEKHGEKIWRKHRENVEKKYGENIEKTWRKNRHL